MMRSVFSIALLTTLLFVSPSASFAQTKAPSPSRAGAALAPGAPVNINTASAAELDALPGIGPVTAQKIVAFRTQHGPFRSVEALDAIPGIGPARIAELQGLVTP